MDVTTFGEVEHVSTTVNTSEDQLTATRLLSELKTKTAVIRYLTADNWSRARIAKSLNIRYQHVRNEQLRINKKTT